MFADDFEKLAKTNIYFRQVLHTCDYSQVVAMSLPIGEDIGEEVHLNTDQIFIIADGYGEVMVGNERRQVEEDDIIVVPAGTIHNVKNIGITDLKLLTIYAPPAHPAGTIHQTKAEAVEAGLLEHMH